MKVYNALGMVLGYGANIGNGGLGAPHYTETEVVDTVPTKFGRYLSNYQKSNNYKVQYSGVNMNGFMQVVLDRDQIMKFSILNEDGSDLPVPTDMASLEFRVKLNITDTYDVLTLNDSSGITLSTSGNMDGDIELPSTLRASNGITAGDYYYEMLMTSDTGEKTQLDFGTIKFIDSLR